MDALIVDENDVVYRVVCDACEAADNIVVIGDDGSPVLVSIG